MIQVYTLKLDSDVDETLFRSLSLKMSERKKERINKFLRKEDALRCLYADLLIRYILIQDHGLKNEEILFGHTAFGKPFCIGLEHSQFNISHSGEWIVCSTHDKPVGIDIELIAPIDMAVAKHYFSKKECERLFSLNSSEQTGFFYDLWTCKESYLKLNGMGLSAPLDSFTISIDNNKVSVISDDAGTLNDIFLRQYDIDPAYKMAVCGHEDAFGNARSITMEEMSDFFLRRSYIPGVDPSFGA